MIPPRKYFTSSGDKVTVSFTFSGTVPRDKIKISAATEPTL